MQNLRNRFQLVDTITYINWSDVALPQFGLIYLIEIFNFNHDNWKCAIFRNLLHKFLRKNLLHNRESVKEEETKKTNDTVSDDWIQGCRQQDGNKCLQTQDENKCPRSRQYLLTLLRQTISPGYNSIGTTRLTSTIFTVQFMKRLKQDSKP
jgi:hypothetical protein